MASDPTAPYELAKLGIPANPHAAWQLPAWYLAALWYGVVNSRCHTKEQLAKLNSRLAATPQTAEQETDLRELGFNDQQIALRRRLAGTTDVKERQRITMEARRQAAKQRPVGR